MPKTIYAAQISISLVLNYLAAATPQTPCEEQPDVMFTKCDSPTNTVKHIVQPRERSLPQTWKNTAESEVALYMKKRPPIADK